MGYFLQKLAEAAEEGGGQRTVGRSARDAAIGAGMGAAAMGAAGGLAYGGARAARSLTGRRAVSARNAYNKAKATIFDNPMDAREARDAAKKVKNSAGKLARGANQISKGVGKAIKKSWKVALPAAAAAGALKGLIHGGKEPAQQED